MADAHRGRARGVYSPAPSTTAQFWGMEKRGRDGDEPPATKLDPPAVRYPRVSVSPHRSVSPPDRHQRHHHHHHQPNGAHHQAAEQRSDADAVLVPRAHLEQLNRDHRELEALLSHHGLPPGARDTSGKAEAPQQRSARDAADVFMRGGGQQQQQAPHQPPQHAAMLPSAAAAQRSASGGDRRPAVIGGIPSETSSDDGYVQKHHELANRIRTLELEAARHEARATAAERQALNAESALARAQVSLETKSNEVKHANTKVRELTRSLADERDENNRLRADVAALQNSLEQQMRGTATRRHDARAATEDTRQLRRELEESRAAETALREECDRLRDKLARHQAHVDRERQRNEEQRRAQAAANARAAQQAEEEAEQQRRRQDRARREAAAAAAPSPPTPAGGERSEGRWHHESPREAPAHTSVPRRDEPTERPSVVVIGGGGATDQRAQHEPPVTTQRSEYQQPPPRSEQRPATAVEPQESPSAATATKRAYVTTGPSEAEAGGDGRGPVRHLFAHRDPGGADANHSGAAAIAWPDYSAARRAGNPPQQHRGDAYTHQSHHGHQQPHTHRHGHQREVQFEGPGAIAWSRDDRDGL